MKKLILISIVLILTSGFTFGQKLKKGNLIGTHAVTIELNAGVTTEQFLDFYMGTLLPEYEKHLKGWKFYMTKGIRGENENKYGWIAVIESEETRSTYIDNEELWEAINEKMKPTTEELDKLGKVTSKFTDWLVL